MPHYEYRCPANGRVVEVRHGMDERLRTWGELVGRAGLDIGGTALDSPVERILSASSVGSSSNGSATGGGCGPGCACAHPV